MNHPEHSPACERKIRKAEGHSYYELSWSCVYNCPVTYGKENNA